MNELLFFLTVILSFLGVLVAFRFWGKAGIFAWIGFSTLLMNIEVLKCIDLFGLPVTLGNVLYGSTFLCTDILSENFGGKMHAKSMIVDDEYTIIGSMNFSNSGMILSQLSLQFVPNDSDFITPHLKAVFEVVPRLTLASIVAFVCSNTLDTYLYEFWSKFTKKIWIRNNASTMISQAVDIIVFGLIGWTGLFPWDVVWDLIWTSYVIKILIAALDTPFAYAAKRIYAKYNHTW